jgi:hypothetical protein
MTNCKLKGHSKALQHINVIIQELKARVTRSPFNMC